MAAENQVEKEAEEFSGAFGEAIAEDAPENEDAPKVKDDAVEVKEKEVEAEEVKVEEVKEPQPKPVENAAEANRSTLLGRIKANRKGLPKMERTYRESYGPIPGDPTEEELAALSERALALEKVDEELPEVSAAIDHKIAAVRGQIREEVEDDITQERNNAHWNELEGAHPDIAAFQTEGSPERDLLQEWINSHEHPDAKVLEEIMAGGSAADVIDMLDLFKSDVEEIFSEQQPKGKETVKQSPEEKAAVQRVLTAADVAEAVPAGMEGTPISAPTIDENDFSGAFKQAVLDDA